MLFKSTLALAFVALANIASSASTPACVLSVVGDTNNPDDLSAICSSKTIQSTIESKCGDNADTALKFFSNTCKTNGFTIESSNTTSSATETASGFVTAASTSGSQATGGTGSSCHTKSGCASSATSTSGSASGAASGSPSGTTTGGTGSSSSSGAGEASASPSFAGAITGQQLSGTTFAAALFFAAAALL
ncbi:Period circadian protein [Penicillium malachiteum]|uniref:Period circadian protein n=1 Tax=Penicillium malachiteum TaxID=1324776 RepID=A0AAD6HG37_9EURO|nr:Period circadian protein [Penicillium malachiteum]